MSGSSPRQLRVLHLVSHGSVSPALQQTLFLPLVVRLPKQRVKSEVVSFGSGFAAAAVLRQNGVPVHEVGLSRKRYSFGAVGDVVKTARRFRPDVIQAWGQTAQLVALRVRSKCSWRPKVLWSVTETSPVERKLGFIDKQKLKRVVKNASKADRIVYTSEVSATQHRRIGFPESDRAIVPPGVDAARFKPDINARRKVREQLGLPANSFVVGMVGPCVPELDYATLFKGVGELIKTNPNLYLILSGHGVQKGNGPLMAMVGGGTMGTRTKLLGEWSDLASFYNAYDVACSTSLIDAHRLTLAAAMLCGVPCVATGVGAQGELLGEFGIAIEQGSPTALMRGIMRVLQMQPERRMFMATGARKHALKNYVGVRCLQTYLQLYFDLVGRQAAAAEEVPTPEIDASVAAIPAELQAAPLSKPKQVAAQDDGKPEWADPDSLETRSTPKQGLEAMAKASEGDILQVFESTTAAPAATSAAAALSNERARGVAEDMGDLLAPEVLETKVERTVVPVASANFNARKKTAKPTTSPPAAAKPKEIPAASPKAKSTEQGPAVTAVPVAPVLVSAPAPDPAPAPAAAATIAAPVAKVEEPFSIPAPIDLASLVGEAIAATAQTQPNLPVLTDVKPPEQSNVDVTTTITDAIVAGVLGTDTFSQLKIAEPAVAEPKLEVVSPPDPAPAPVAATSETEEKKATDTTTQLELLPDLFAANN